MSQTKRRTLNAAIDVSPEKLAFIRGGVPDDTSAKKQDAPAGTPVQSVVQNISAQSQAQDEPIELETVVETDSIERKRTRSRGRGSHAAKDEPMAGIANLLVPLTTRLTPATAAALKRAGLEQKLYGRKPGTVQEIVENSLRLWLQGEGYI